MVYQITDPVIKEFLDSIERNATKNSYKTFLRRYLEWSGKTGKQLIEEKLAHPNDGKVEKSLAFFRKWILESGKSSNYASSALGAVGGFYHYKRCKLNFTQSESRRLRERSRTTQDYHFDKEDIERMAKYANLKEKYVLLVGKSVGLRGSDFLRFTYGLFRCAKLENDAPISLGEFMTNKETEKAFPFLDSDSLPIVRDWLELNKSKADDLRILDDTEENLSLILQSLCKKAGMEIKSTTIHGKRVRFHCLRKFLIDRLSVHSSESQWKQIVGKAIGEGAYVTQDQLKTVYQKAMKDISIHGNRNSVKTKKLLELENALIDSQKRLGRLETTNEALRKELLTVTWDLDKFHRQIIQMKPLFDNMDEISKLLQERLWQKEQQARAEREVQEHAEKEKAMKEFNL